VVFRSADRQEREQGVHRTVLVEPSGIAASSDAATLANQSRALHHDRTRWCAPPEGPPNLGPDPLARKQFLNESLCHLPIEFLQKDSPNSEFEADEIEQRVTGPGVGEIDENGLRRIPQKDVAKMRVAMDECADVVVRQHLERTCAKNIDRLRNNRRLHPGAPFCYIRLVGAKGSLEVTTPLIGALRRQALEQLQDGGKDRVDEEAGSIWRQILEELF